MSKWDLFLTTSGSKQMCRLCNRVLQRQKRSSTCGYLYHFKSKHPVEFAQVTGKPAQQDEIEVEKNLKEPDVKRKPPPQQTIEQAFSLWSEDGQRTNDIHRAIMQFICVDVQPLMAVEKAGFKNLLKVLAPQWKHLKSRMYYSRALPILYNEYESKLKKELAEAEFVAVSFDLFSDEGNVHQIIGTVVHFLKGCEQAYRVLGIIDVKDDRHHGTVIRNKLEELFEAFAIQSKVVAVIRDGASNVALAGALLEVDNWDCLSHKLNLAAKQGCHSFTGITAVIEKLKKIIKKLRKSSQAKREFEQFQALLDLPSVALIKNCDVRWTSLFEMISRAIQLKDAISLLLAKHMEWPSLTLSDWEVMEAARQILKPMIDAIKFTEDRAMTASAVIPLVNLMISEAESAHEYPVATQAIANKLRIELRKYEKIEYLNIASALDPRFKLTFVSSIWRDRLKEILLDEINCASLSPPQSAASVATEDDPFQRYLEKQAPVAKATGSTNKRVLIIAELEKFFAEPPSTSTNPLKYWSDPIVRSAYPHLAQLIPKYFCSPPGTVETERVFSVAGRILNDLRKTLTTENFGKLLFLNVNIPLLGF